MIKEVATIRFTDAESGEENIAIIRVVERKVALCLSQKENGDIEVFLRIEDCKAIIEALHQAISTVN